MEKKTGKQQYKKRKQEEIPSYFRPVIRFWIYVKFDRNTSIASSLAYQM